MTMDLLRAAEDEIRRLRTELAEARALYVQAQQDLNEAVGNVVALRIELADYKADFEDMRDGTGRFAGEGYYDLRAELANARDFAALEYGAWQTMNDRRGIAEERLAAVIALCDSLDGDTWRPATGRTVVQEIRAAIEGNQP